MAKVSNPAVPKSGCDATLGAAPSTLNGGKTPQGSIPKQYDNPMTPETSKSVKGL